MMSLFLNLLLLLGSIFLLLAIAFLGFSLWMIVASIIDDLKHYS